MGTPPPSSLTMPDLGSSITDGTEVYLATIEVIGGCPVSVNFLLIRNLPDKITAAQWLHGVGHRFRGHQLQYMNLGAFRCTGLASRHDYNTVDDSAGLSRRLPRYSYR